MAGRLLGGAAAAATLAAVAPAPATVVVPVGDNYFGHDAGHDHDAPVHVVTISSGTLVRWIWVGTARHNVTVVAGPLRFRSRTQRSGTYLARPRTRGSYRIVCTIHGRADQSMILRVR
jgi:plastocyanin